MAKCFAQKTCWMLLVLLMMLAISPSAEAGMRKTYLENRVVVSIGLRGGKTIMFVAPNSGNQSQPENALDIGLSDGFEFMASYRWIKYLNAGLVYTNYASQNGAGQQYHGLVSRSQLGFSGFIATPWTKLSKSSSYLHYRANIGMILDVTGLKVDALSSQQKRITVGRLRENRIFFSGEVGIKCFGTEGTGMLFVRLSYVRSIYSFHPTGGSQTYDFVSDSNNSITLAVGISI